jgi:DNA-binding transcriptional MerR regulator
MVAHSGRNAVSVNPIQTIFTQEEAMPSPQRSGLPKAHPAEDTEPRYRSGAAARMARMPVATLRTWERRFQVVAPVASPSGHRLYSAVDVHRLTLLKQLSDRGHAIGHLAKLDLEALRQVATTHATLQSRASSRPDAQTQAPTTPWRVVVVGMALAERLKRSTIRQQLVREVDLIGPYANVADCLAGARDPWADAEVSADPSERSARLGAPDLLLLDLPTLQEGQAAELQELAGAWRTPHAALICSYALPSACDALRLAGFAVQRGPMSDEALADWLRWLSDPPKEAAPGFGASAPPPWPGTSWALAGAPPPRRFDDTTLADMAALSSAVACECPHHVSQLVIQLSAFEVYSAQCASQTAGEAELHRYLQHTAASARALLELALERIALHEGLLLKV